MFVAGLIAAPVLAIVAGVPAAVFLALFTASHPMLGGDA